MLEEFKLHIKNVFPSLLNNTFLLACSGGVDSVVLAHLCAKNNLDFSIAHCNFKLRGEESDADEQFAQTLAHNLNKLYFATSFDTIGYVKVNKVSVQVAARELRYQWFAKLVQEKGFKSIVTAHQADDNLETFLINLSRGTGIDGLIGIPEQTDILNRPLLKFSRAQIMAYAKAENLRWHEDSSNTETKYLRNKIRHEIIPHLKELHPTFLENFNRTQEYLKQTSAIVENHIKDLKEALFQKEGNMLKIEVASLLALSPLKGYLYALFREYGFTEWDDVKTLLSGVSGKEVRSKTHRLVKDRELLLLVELNSINTETYQIPENAEKIKAPIHITISMVDAIGETDKNVLYVDKETLKYPLRVRKWQKGDYFYPFGMTGRKKLSKFFKDNKMDVISKEKQWLLYAGENLVWIIGQRPDDRFKVTEKSKNILKFTFHE